MLLTIFAAVLVASIGVVVAIAYFRFRTIGTEMSPREFFTRLLRGAGFGNLSPAQLQSHLRNLPNDRLLVDLREPDRFEKDHLAGAISRPFDDFLKEVVVEEKYRKDQEIILICDTGHMSRVAADILAEDEGYSHVSNLLGGMKAWDKHMQSCRRLNCCGAHVCG